MTPSVYISVPCGGGVIDLEVLSRLQHTETLIRLNGAGVQWALTPGHACLTAVRNQIAADFLRSPCTHILMVDSDVVVEPHWVLELLHLQESIVGGYYIRKIPGVWSPTFHVFDGLLNMEEFRALAERRELLEVDGLATGFMLVHRRVFERIRAEGKDSYTAREVDGRVEELYNWFPTQTYPIVGGGREFATEDIGFCRLAREHGFKSWLAPWMQAGHKGVATFGG